MPGALTLEKMKAAMDAIDALPPVPFFASSSMLPNDKAYKFQFECREYVGAGPAFWAHFRKEVAIRPDPFGIPIWDLDAEGNEDKRKEFFRALAIIVSSGAGPIEDAIATALERGHFPKPGAIINPNPAG